MGKIIFRVATLCLLASSLGCAFKETQQAAPDSSPKTNGSPFASPQSISREKHGLVAVQWLEEDQTLSPKYEREISAEDESKPLRNGVPVTVSHGVPEELLMTFSVPSLKMPEISQVLVHGSLSSSRGVPYGMPVSDLSKDEIDSASKSPVMKFKVSGLRKLLPPDQETEAFLSMSVLGTNGNTPVEEIHLRIVTPPSRLVVEHLTLADFETKYRPIDPKNKTLRSVSTRLDLLQIVTIKNNSSRPVVNEIPLGLEGAITAHFKRLSLDQQRCSHSIASQEWDESLAKALYLLPISAEISGNFSNFLNKHLNKNAFEIPLEPGEEKLLGIYGSGDQIPDLARGALSLQRFQQTQVVTGCKSRCPNANSVTFPDYWLQRGWAGASKACVDSYYCTLAPGAWSPHISDALCNQCMEWDLTENHAWRDGNGPIDPDYRKTFCRGNEPGKRGWTVEYQNATVETGTQRYPVYLRLSPGSTAIKAWFLIPGEKEKSPDRAFVNFFKSEVIQSQ